MRYSFQPEIGSKNVSCYCSGGIAITTGVAVMDKYVVDGTVEGVAKATTGTGKIVALVQNGYARAYASYMTIGVVVVLIIALATRI